jgi:hypothetical protein
MPTMLSKFIDKAKPRLSLKRQNHKKSDSSSNENHKFHLGTALPTTSITNHIFGYRDDKEDKYVEPPPGKPL